MNIKKLFIYVFFCILVIQTVSATITISLNVPANNTWNNSVPIIFGFTPSITGANSTYLNCSLYGDFSGAWNFTAANTSAIVNASQNNISYSPTNGTFIWNVECYDNGSFSYFAAANYTINVDTVAPTVVNLTTPANNSNQTSKNIVFNFTSYDNLDTILNYTLYINGTANTTGLTTGNNTATNLTLTMANGDYSWLIGLTDEAGNEVNSSQYIFSLTCAESWSYSSWSTCSGGTQTRTATDANSCGTTTNRGDLSQSCTVSSGSGSSSGVVSKTTIGATSKTVILDMTDKAIFTVNNKVHYVNIKKIYTDYVTVTVHSPGPIDVDLYKGKTEKVDVNEDDIYDLAMTLEEIYTLSAKITFKTISEKISELVPEEIPEVEEAEIEEAPLVLPISPEEKPAPEIITLEIGIIVVGITIAIMVVIIATILTIKPDILKKLKKK